MKTITKTSLITLAVAAAVAVAPQAAFAHKTGKTHTHAKAVRSSSHAAAAPAVSSNDARFRALESEIQALRGELGRTRAETKSAVSAVAQKADAQEAALDAKLVEHDKHEKTHKDLLFFRGGYASMAHNRNDEVLVGNQTVTTPDSHNGGAGWYIGAGLDHRLTNDLWGLTDLIALDGEIMVQYMNFGESKNTLVSIYPGASAPGAFGIMKNQVTQFTLAASPKLKFNTGTIFTPWIIPFGLSFNVISPPSSGVTVLNPGLMLGVGGEVDVWKAIVAGVDFRYNFTGGDLAYNNVLTNGQQVRVKGMSTDGLTAGGYFGFKF